MMETMGRRSARVGRSPRSSRLRSSSWCRQRRTSVGEVAPDLDLTETAVRRWVKQADVDAGQRDGSDHGRAGGAGAAAQGEPGAARGARHPEAGDGFLREGDPVNVFPFIEAEKASSATSPRRARCSRSPGPPSTSGTSIARRPAAGQDAELGERIRPIHDESPGTYGCAPGAPASCAATACTCGRKRVARIMRERGPGRPVPAAVQDDHHLRPGRPRRVGPAEAGVRAGHRRARPGLRRRHHLHLRTWEGWVYLATVIDLACRRVVGWAMADHMRSRAWSATRCAWPSRTGGRRRG